MARRYNLPQSVRPVLAENPAVYVSVDFPAGRSGSCRQTCAYCYARKGRQNSKDARRLQWRRYNAYLADPAGYAERIAWALKRLSRTLPVPVGSAEFPLRLFGSGDLGRPDRFRAFTKALAELGVSWFGYTRWAELAAEFPGRLVFSADRETNLAQVLAAKKAGAKVAFVRQVADQAPPWADIVFPEHRTKDQIPWSWADCPKVRGLVDRCYKCGRCFR